SGCRHPGADLRSVPFVCPAALQNKHPRSRLYSLPTRPMVVPAASLALSHADICCCRREPVMKVQSLFIYPVKSLAGIRVQAFEMDDFGAAQDRRWMIVDAERNFVSQRTHPELA